MAGVNPCILTNVLADNYFKAVRAVNRKFNALRRLAELLEQLGDVAGALPNISALIPLYLVNLDSYTNLVTACPFLNLPQHPSNEDVAKLQAQIASAYSQLIQSLKLHPYFRMDKLQSQLDKVQTKVNVILNDGAQFVTCLQQACNSAADTVNFVNKVVTADVTGEVDQYTRNYLAASGKVLTEPMQGKASEVRGMIDNVNELMTTAPVVTPNVSPTVPQVPIPFNHPVPPPPSGGVP